MSNPLNVVSIECRGNYALNSGKARVLPDPGYTQAPIFPHNENTYSFNSKTFITQSTSKPEHTVRVKLLN